MSQEKIYDGPTKGIYAAPLWGRMFLYAFGYVPLTLIAIWLCLMALPQNGLTNNEAINLLLLLALMFLPSASPFILFEMTVRSFRKRWGLPMNKNVVEDLERLKAKGTK